MQRKVGRKPVQAFRCVLYNRTAGTLWYDGNGNLAGGAILLATLISKPLLTAGDFFVV